MGCSIAGCTITTAPGGTLTLDERSLDFCQGHYDFLRLAGNTPIAAPPAPDPEA